MSSGIKKIGSGTRLSGGRRDRVLGWDFYWRDIVHIEISKMAGMKAYGLLTSLVVPRPIAWVVSKDKEGRLNCAPFSFFNLLGQSPLIVGLGIGVDSAGRPKHSRANILATGEFVVHMVPESLIGRMNITATDFPEGVNELEMAGLTTAACELVKVPRIAEAPVAIECRFMQETKVGSNVVLFGEVLGVHLAEGILDEKGHVQGHAPIGRLGSPNMYARTEDRFELGRVSYEEWKAGRRG